MGQWDWDVENLRYNQFVKMLKKNVRHDRLFYLSNPTVSQTPTLSHAVPNLNYPTYPLIGPKGGWEGEPLERVRWAMGSPLRWTKLVLHVTFRHTHHITSQQTLLL